MGTLRVSLFGDVRVVHPKTHQPMKLTRVIKGLLAFLLLQRGRSHTREALAGTLWGGHGESQARGCLNTALWRLRRTLEPESCDRGTFLESGAYGEVGFNFDSDHWLDVSDFEDRVSHVLDSEEGSGVTEDFEEALCLYRGDLLEGYYDDWVLGRREHYRDIYLNALIHLMGHHRAQGNPERSIDYGHQILSLEPLREEIHREVIRIHIEFDQRALALRQYEACRQTLKEELGVSPMDETQALYRECVSHGGRSGQSSDDPHLISVAIQQLRRTLQAFEEAGEQLKAAIQDLERGAPSCDPSHVRKK